MNAPQIQGWHSDFVQHILQHVFHNGRPWLPENEMEEVALELLRDRIELRQERLPESSAFAGEVWRAAIIDADRLAALFLLQTVFPDAWAPQARGIPPALSLVNCWPSVAPWAQGIRIFQGLDRMTVRPGDFN